MLEYSTKVEADVDGDGDIVMKLKDEIMETLAKQPGNTEENAHALAMRSIEGLMETLTQFLENDKK